MSHAGHVPPLTHLTKHLPINSVRLSLADISSIYERLTLVVAEQAEVELTALVKPPEKTDDEWNDYINRARETAFKITTTITGRDGSSLLGNSSAVFNAANRPDKISSIFMSNVTAYQSFSSVKPLNSFSVNFDFTKSPLLEGGVVLSAPTSNLSNLHVEGNREGWVASVQAAVSAIVEQRRTRRGWLHRAFRYDIGLFLFGLPFALYLCWRFSSIIEKTFNGLSGIIKAGAYVYVFLVALFIYRTLFGYAKWSFPTVELTDNNDEASRHRAVLGAIVLALIVNVLWELRSLL